MIHRFRAWLVPGCIGLQVVGLAIWWEWFNAYAFDTGSIFGAIIKFFVLSGFFVFWSFKIPSLMNKKFDQNTQSYREKDALAGLPLCGLLLLIPLAKPLALATKLFSFKLFGYLWMPWWMKSIVINPEAKLVLVVAGLFIVSAMILKVLLLIRTLYQTSEEKITTKRLFWMGLLIYIMLLSWPACTQAPQSGEVSHLLVTQSVALDGTFHIEGVLGRADYYQFYPHQKITYHGYTDKLRRLFLPVAPGMPLLYITFFLMQGRWLLAVLAMVFAVGAASQLFGFCRDQQFSPRVSFWVWLSALFSAPLLLYGYQQTEVTAGAFFLMLGIRYLFKLQKQSVSESLSSVAIVALAGGLLLLGGIRFLIPALFIILFLSVTLVLKKRFVHLLAMMLVLLAPLAFTIWYYSTIYSFFLTHMPYQLQWPWTFNGWLNFLSVFFDRYAGVVWSAPLWVIGFAGVFKLVEKRGWILAVAVLFPFFTGLIASMIFPGAWGEGSSYHRFVAPMIPLFGLGLAAFLEKVESSAVWRKRVLWLGFWGTGIMAFQTVFPFLATEIARVRLGLHFQPLGWIYGWLPSFKGRVIMLDVLIGALLMIGLMYGMFRLFRFIQKPLSLQTDEKPKPRIV